MHAEEDTPDMDHASMLYGGLGAAWEGELVVLASPPLCQAARSRLEAVLWLTASSRAYEGSSALWSCLEPDLVVLLSLIRP